MPWTIDDVDGYKAGLTLRQKRAWVRVANSALHACLARQGTAQHCEAEAIRQANTVAGQITPTVEASDHAPTMLRFAVHAGFTVRYESFEDRPYIVAPIVPIVEGILNDYYVPRDEIAMFVEAWDGRPVPVDHPRNEYGDYISANSPNVLENSIGRFFHARMDGARLVGEIWLDLAKCEQMGGDAAECVRRLEAGELIECSTAFFPETEEQPGTFKGQRYLGIHRHLRPDHIALLPHGVGACDASKGCGVRAQDCGCPTCHGSLSAVQTITRRLLNSEFDANLEVNMDHDKQGRFKTAIQTILAFASGGGSEEPSAETRENPSLATHLTHDDLRLALYAELARQRGLMYGPDCIMDIEAGYAVYRDGERCFRQAYAVDDAGVVTLTGEKEEVQRNTTYVPVAAQTGDVSGGVTLPQVNKEGEHMKAELVKKLIAHAQTAWGEDDAGLLDTFTEAQLTRLVAHADASSHTSAATTVTSGQGVTLTAVVSAEPVTLEAIRTLLATELSTRDAALEARLAVHSQEVSERQERLQLVTHLTANGFTEPECAAMPLETLRKVAQTLAPVTYAGMGFPRFPAQGDEELPEDEPGGWARS